MLGGGGGWEPGAWEARVDVVEGRMAVAFAPVGAGRLEQHLTYSATGPVFYFTQ